MKNSDKSNQQDKRKQQKCSDLAELEKQLLTLDIILPHKREIDTSLLPTFLAFDSTAYKTCQQIKLENKEQKKTNQRNKILYQRADRLQNLIDEGKNQLGNAFDQFNRANQISLELSEIRQADELNHFENRNRQKDEQREIINYIKNIDEKKNQNANIDLPYQIAQQPINHQKQKKSEIQKKQVNLIEKAQSVKQQQQQSRSVQRKQKNKLNTQAQAQLKQNNYDNQNVNFLNFEEQVKPQQNRATVRRVQKPVTTQQNWQISELKRPEYHKKSQTASELKILCIQQTNQKLLKPLTKESINYEDYFTQSRTPKVAQKSKREQMRKSSYSPKLQKPVKPLMSQNSFANNQNKRKVYIRLQNPQRQKYGSNDLYNKKQEVSIYVQTDDLEKDQRVQTQKRSLQLLDKFAKKTDRSLLDIEKQINDLKQKVSQLHESRIFERETIEKEVQFSKGRCSNTNSSVSATQGMNNKSQVKSYMQFYSNPEPVQQQQIWQCEQDQLQQEIRQLNQQISQRNLHKQKSPYDLGTSHRQKTDINRQAQRQSFHSKKANQNSNKSPRVSTNNVAQRLSNPSNGNTKRVMLDLTPDKFSTNKTPKANKERYKQTQMQLLVQEPRMTPQNGKGYFSSKTPTRANQKQFVEDQKLSSNINCSKWQKKGTKKQLLSAKIANLRQ